MESTNYKLIGQRIREARKRKDLTQKELAEHFGLDRTRICNWENGHLRTIRPYVLKELCVFLNVNELWLLGYDAPRTRRSEQHRQLCSEIENCLEWLDEKELALIKTMVEQMKASKTDE